MNPEPGPPGGTEEEVLVVQRRPRWLPVLLATVLLVVVAVLLVVHHESTPSAAPTQPASTSTSTSAVPPATTSAVPPRPPVGVIELGHALLGVTGSAELFGRGPGVVVRIELARGRITTTTIPLSQSGGPVYFVIGKHEAIIRPLDFVPGYVVPDGRPAHEFSGALGHVASGPMFPGPDGNSVWAATSDSGPLALVHLADGRPGPTLQRPRGVSSIEGTPDGSGYVVYDAADGVYDSRPDGLRRVTTASVIAVGPTRWLTRTCDGNGDCPISEVDPRGGASHQVARSFGNADVVPGVVSPDGAGAGVIVLFPTPALLYIDLRTGAESVMPLEFDPSADPRQALVWSPDSRWLFAVGGGGSLYAIDARTRRITDFRTLGAPLPGLSQIAIR